MKLKNDLILRQVADTWVVLPLSKEILDFNGMLRLNESGALLWRAMQEGADLVDVLTTEYDVDREQAAADVDAFLNSLRSAGCVED